MLRGRGGGAAVVRVASPSVPACSAKVCGTLGGPWPGPYVGMPRCRSMLPLSELSELSALPQAMECVRYGRGER